MTRPRPDPPEMREQRDRGDRLFAAFAVGWMLFLAGSIVALVAAMFWIEPVGSTVAVAVIVSLLVAGDFLARRYRGLLP